MKKIIILGTAILLAGCATASQPGAMLAPVTNATMIDNTSKLHQTVSMGDVNGGKKTNPLWTSEVSSEDFAEALKQSLAAHAMLATDTGNYRLDAELKKLKQPIMGVNMSVTSVVDYTLTNVDTGAVVLSTTVEEKYTAKLGDAFVGVKRLQLANEGSIKSNISNIIKQMIDKVDGMSAPMAQLPAAQTNG